MLGRIVVCYREKVVLSIRFMCAKPEGSFFASDTREWWDTRALEEHAAGFFCGKFPVMPSLDASK